MKEVQVGEGLGDSGGRCGWQVSQGKAQCEMVVIGLNLKKQCASGSWAVWRRGVMDQDEKCARG